MQNEPCEHSVWVRMVLTIQPDTQISSCGLDVFQNAALSLAQHEFD